MKSMCAQFYSFLDRKIKECGEQELLLISQCRKDESNLCKIRANIYNIYRTLFQAAEKQGGEDAVCVMRCFEEKAGRVSEAWKTSFEKAREHRDAGKILVEEEKLSAAEEIMKFYRHLKEERSDD